MKRMTRAILAVGMSVAFTITAYAEPDTDTAADMGDSGSKTISAWSDLGIDQSSESLSDEDIRQLMQLINSDQSSLEFKRARNVKPAFDTETEMYLYTLPNEYQFGINIPNGAVTSDPVRISAAEDSTELSVTKDNEEYDTNGSYYFSEPGSYVIDMLCSPGNYSGTDLVMYQYRVSFTILRNGLSRQRFLNAPYGYEIGHVSCNGQPVEFTSGSCIYLNEDGNYQVRFSADGLPDYRISFKKDTQAPTLTFSQSITKKALKLPVSFEKQEPESNVTVYRNGSEAVLSGQALNQGGWYQIRVADEAGNTRDYHFFVKQTYHLFNKELLMLLAAVMIGGIILLKTGGMELRSRD